ncbi:protein phosphatase 2C domain-containing protein [Paenibacillus filicis]|uniref:Protein phosphatase 2C domain-containing protein n=1 Tax=Paenibacillus filicis TaxID=669464 RepID=A0ABU9DMG1_9BACL
MRSEWISIQGTGEWNEDAVVVHEAQGIYGVIDGATSLVPFRGTHGETGGRLASHLVKEYIEGLPPDTESGTLETLMKEANRRLGEAMLENGIDLAAKDQLWTAGFALIRVTDHGIEYAQAGDCMIFAIYEDGSVRTVTRDHVAHIDEESRQIWEQGIASGIGSKATLWEQVKPRILANKEKMNTLHGYSVMNGKPDAEMFFEYGRLNRICLQGLLLITDGLFFPREIGHSLLDPETELWRQVQAEGLQNYANWLLDLEREDPECIRIPRFKVSDDKSAVWLRLDA